MDRTEWRLVCLWGLLIAITLVSWQSIRSSFLPHDEHLQAILVIFLVFIKVRIVLLDFMQVRGAPIVLRLLIEAWALVVGGALVFIIFRANPANP